jgi:hypothetical protein
VPSQVTVSARVPSLQRKRTRPKRAGAVLKPVTHLADPGQITKYKLEFTGALKKALRKLPKRKTLALKVRASGANVAGVEKSVERTLRLKGRG